MLVDSRIYTHIHIHDLYKISNYKIMMSIVKTILKYNLWLNTNYILFYVTHVYSIDLNGFFFMMFSLLLVNYSYSMINFDKKIDYK